MERSLRILRSLRARGRGAFLSDEVVQDRGERHAQLLAQACADIALHILAGTGTAAPETYAEALSALAADAVIPGPLGARLAQAVRLPELVTLRAGGLIPIARQYPGALEFVEAHNREYPGADLGDQTAAGYAGC